MTWPLPPNTTCSLHIPSWSLWSSALAVHGTCAFFGMVPMAVFLYINRQRNAALGCGVLAALAAFQYESEHWVRPFLVSAFGFSAFFKCVNAAFRQYPPGADETLGKWLIWFAVIPEPEIKDRKFVPITSDYMKHNATRVVGKCVGLFFLVSYLQSNSERPGYAASGLEPGSFFDLHVQGFFHTWFVFLLASFRLDLFSLIASTVTGFQFMQGFDGPLIKSRSFREAWGVAWNRPVHSFLKRSVYLPARRNGCGKSIAALLTFFVSGLLHEYNFSIHNRGAYQPGLAVLFFLSMGMYMTLEGYVWNMVPRDVLAKSVYIPSAVLAIFYTLLSSGLVEKLFISSWMQVGALNYMSQMWPHLICESVPV